MSTNLSYIKLNPPLGIQVIGVLRFDSYSIKKYTIFEFLSKVIPKIIKISHSKVNKYLFSMIRSTKMDFCWNKQ